MRKMLWVFLLCAVTNGQAQTFKRGVIVPHWMSDLVSVFNVFGGDWFAEDDVRWIAGQGFDHVRIKVDSYLLMDAAGRFDAARLEPLNRAIGWAKQHGLGVVLLANSVPGYRDYPRGAAPGADAPTPFNDQNTMQAAEDYWRQLAAALQSHDAHLRFEVIAAPRIEDQAALDDFQRRMLRAIRASNPKRTVYLTTLGSSTETVSGFKFPADDANVALAVDSWGPNAFVFQYRRELPMVRFPGVVPDFSPFVAEDDAIRAESNRVLNMETIRQPVETLAQWAGEHALGREIYISSFGVYHRADPRSTQTWIEAQQAAFEEQGFSWAIYDYKSGCRMREADGRPSAALLALNLQPL